MKRINNISLAKKLWLIVAIFCLGLTVVGVGALSATAKLSRNTTQIAEGSVNRLLALAKISQEARQTRTREYRYMVAKNDEKRAGLMEDMAENIANTDAAISDYAKYATLPSDKQNAVKLAELWKQYSDFHATIPAIWKGEGMAGVTQLLEKTSRGVFVEQFIPLVEEMGEWNKTKAQEQKVEGNQLAVSTRNLIWTLWVICVGLGAGLSWFVIRAIMRGVSSLKAGVEKLETQQIAQLAGAMKSLENFDLTIEITATVEPLPVHGDDELGKMSSSFNGLQVQVAAAIHSYESARQSLTKLVADVRLNASRVAEASRVLAEATDQSGRSATEIAAGGERLAYSATDAAASMERFRLAIQEIEEGSSIQEKSVEKANSNLNTAKQSVDSVAAAATQMAAMAQSGGEAVRETVSSMESIREQVGMTAEKVRDLDEKGQQIGQIVSTIQAIAEQTNLLALNAAIEAARAGDHGRGFAVVADEVRKLAEQSSSATKEISTLIESVRTTVTATVDAIALAQERVATGTTQSQSAGESLHEIVASAAEVADQLSEAATAATDLEKAMGDVHAATQRTAELTATVSQDSMAVAGAIEEVASISEETAAGSEEMSASSEEVAASASELNTLATNLRGSVAAFRMDEASEVKLKRAA
jgi:methyl-accepting chemotaxis protein